MILVRSPLQASLIGWPTFEPEWSEHHPSAMLGVAVNRYCYGVRTNDGSSHIYVDYGQGAMLAFRFGSAWEVTETLLAATAEGKHASKSTLSKAANSALACVYGGVGLIRGTSGVTNWEPVSRNVTMLEQHLMVIRLNNLDSVSYYRPRPVNAFKQELHAIYRLAESSLTAINNGDFKRLGDLIEQGLKIETKVTCTIMSKNANLAMLKAKLAGAYGVTFDNQFMYLIAPPDKHQDIIAAMSDIHYPVQHCPTSIDRFGATIVHSE